MRGWDSRFWCSNNASGINSNYFFSGRCATVQPTGTKILRWMNLIIKWRSKVRPWHDPKLGPGFSGPAFSAHPKFAVSVSGFRTSWIRPVVVRRIRLSRSKCWVVSGSFPAHSEAVWWAGDLGVGLWRRRENTAEVASVHSWWSRLFLFTAVNLS